MSPVAGGRLAAIQSQKPEQWSPKYCCAPYLTLLTGSRGTLNPKTISSRNLGSENFATSIRTAKRAALKP